jgi:antitoxin component of MazEF toxin-antitoxin module
MELRLRRVGNSLGVIIPRRTLDAWSLAEGGALEVRGRSLVPSSTRLRAHEALDELKRALAVAVVDLAISKYVAGREKDRLFNRELVARGLLLQKRLLTLLEETQVAEPVRKRVVADIASDFAKK